VIKQQRAIKGKLTEYATSIRVASGLIDMYKVRWINNLRYILAFVGMTEKRYSRDCINSHYPNPRPIIRWIESDELVGFDIIHAATTSAMFGIPVHLIINIDFADNEIDLSKYKLIKDMYNEKILRSKSVNRMVARNPMAIRKHAGKFLKDAELRAKRVKLHHNPKNV
jgi:hypothetical protein